MKKALPGQHEVFIIERFGNVLVWDFFAEELLDSANKGLKKIPTENLGETLVYQHLAYWMCRYLEEGVTDDFLDDLNKAIHEIRYSKYILPMDLLPSEIGYPKNGYVAKYDVTPEPKAYAADDFSKLLTSGQLKRLNRCQLEECGKFFLGPPQKKWCSKPCGSKSRVREKRQRDKRR